MQKVVLQQKRFNGFILFMGYGIFSRNIKINILR